MAWLVAPPTSPPWRQPGDPATGRAMIEEALAISTDLGDVQGIGNCHRFLAWIDGREGNRSGAIAHYREALARFERVGSPDAEDVRRDLRALAEQT